MRNKSAKDEAQAKAFAIDASVKAQAAFKKHYNFFTSQVHRSNVQTVVSTLKSMLKHNNFAYYEKLFETPRDQLKKGVFTDVTVFKFMPNSKVKSSQIISAMHALGFVATYNPKSQNINIVVR